MRNLIKKYVLLVIAVLISLSIFAGEVKNRPLNIVVTGTGSLEVPVDYITISIDIIVKDTKDQLKTKLQSDEAVRDIVSIARSFNIDKKDIDASYISIGINYKSDENDNSIFNAYMSERSVILILRNLKVLDTILTKIVAIKSTQIYDLSFGSDKKNNKISETLFKKAIENAKKQANMMSTLLGLKLGKILEVDFETKEDDSDMFFGTEEGNNDKKSQLKSSFIKESIILSRIITIRYELKYE